MNWFERKAYHLDGIVGSVRRLTYLEKSLCLTLDVNCECALSARKNISDGLCAASTSPSALNSQLSVSL